MLTKQKFFDSIRDDLETFPRHSSEGEKKIFSIYTIGILPDEFFAEDQTPYKKRGMIVIEVTKLEKEKTFMVLLVFENHEDQISLNSTDFFSSDESKECWEFVNIFLSMVREKGDIHILSAKGDNQKEENYGKLFEQWITKAYEIDGLG